MNLEDADREENGPKEITIICPEVLPTDCHVHTPA
jgi:hypothetical protein